MRLGRTASFVALAAGALLIAAALSLGNSRAVDAAPGPTMQTLVNAWNAGDAATFNAHITDDGLLEMFPFFESAAEAREAIQFFVGEPPLTLVAVRDQVGTVGGSSATVDLGLGIVLWSARASFVFQDGLWRLDGFERRDAPVPAGAVTVDMRLQEYAFVYDRAAVAGGNFALNVSNVGVEDHEIILIRLDPSLPPVAQLVMEEPTEEEEELIQFLGVDVWSSGETRRMSLTQPLSPGRYTFICFLDSPQGIPHAVLGMFSEFTVGPPVAAPIRPPATGGAGLMERAPASTLSLAMLAAGAVVLVSGIGGLLATRRA